MTPTTEDWHFLARWMLASVLGWSVGLAVAVALVGAGLVLRFWLPVWAVALALPVAGAVAGGVVGWAQWTAFGRAPEDRAWVRNSAVGGGAGGALGGALAAALASNPLAAAVVLGAGLAAGIAFGQSLTVRQGGTVWWVLANALGGAACALLAPSGHGAWLPLTCLLGTGLFGVVTGAVLLRGRY